MSKENFARSMNLREHIRREFEYADINSSKGRRTTTEVEGCFTGLEVARFKKLLSYLECECGKFNVDNVDKEKIEIFKNTKDNIERLRLLRIMNIREAIQAIREAAYTKGAKKYLADRLDFYQRLIQGKKDVTPDTVRVGLFRDILFASMIGSPEMAIYKIAKKKCKDWGLSRVILKGYHSEITPGPNGSIGDGYPFLHKLYEEARKFIEQRATEEEKHLGEKYLEHRAVLLASEWLVESEKFFCGTNDEAVAWARLGDKRVKARLRGMNCNMGEYIYLGNIKRFIGKSEPNKYEGERKLLYRMLKILTEGDEQEKQDLLEKENNLMKERQINWFIHEKERLKQRFEKAKARIEQEDLSDEERVSQLAALQESFNAQIADLEIKHQQKLDYFQNRTLQQLLADLRERQKIVEERYEKRKNLAQKALDLHFHFNHHGGDYHSKPFHGIVDWINEAPFGTIKRAHKMMQLGIPDEKIIEYAVADIIAGKRGATRDDLKAVRKLLREISKKNSEVKALLVDMVKVGNILARFGYEVSLQKVEQLSRKRYYGLKVALREYSLDEAIWFMDQNLDLRNVTKIRKISKKHGYDLDNTAIAEIMSHNFVGLDNALRVFGLDDTKKLLSQDIFLPNAINVQDKIKAHGYELSIDEIAIITKSIGYKIEDLVSALHNLTLEQVVQLYSAEQNYEKYKIVSSALTEHGYEAEFAKSLVWTQRLAKHREWRFFSTALNVFSLEEIEQIIDNDVMLSDAFYIRKALTKLGLENSLKEIMRWSKVVESPPYDRIIRAAEKFGTDNLLRIVEESVPLEKVWDVKAEIKQRELEHFDTIEIIIAFAKNGCKVELAQKAVEAGFTVEEIIKYPFLVSTLIDKANY